MEDAVPCHLAFLSNSLKKAKIILRTALLKVNNFCLFRYLYRNFY